MESASFDRAPGGDPEARDDAPGVLARLRASGLVPTKALGQHFLHDPKLLRAIVREAGVLAEDRVLEVGTGPATLTRILASVAAQVLTIEVDPGMLAFARTELAGRSNIEFLHANALDGTRRLHPELVARASALGDFVWVSNLPFAIATTLMVLMAESRLNWKRAALTVQAEVAHRVAAEPGGKAWGPATLLLRYWVRARSGRSIPAGAFWPPPRVDARLLHLERRDDPIGSLCEYAAYRSWVKVLFQARRRQLRSRLHALLGDPETDRVLGRSGLSPTLRVEALGEADILALARASPQVPGSPPEAQVAEVSDS